MDSNKKIIVTSTQYPRYGGAATAAYEMHKYLIKRGIPSICIFFDNSVYKRQSKLNPDQLQNVYGAIVTKDYMNIGNIYCDIKTTVKKIYGDEPYIIYAFNYLAPILSKIIFPTSVVYYLITGCNYINDNNLIDTTTFLNAPFKLDSTDSIEKYTMQISDHIVPNSELMKNLLEYIYKINLDEPIDLHEIFKLNNGIGDNSTYDIVFICSNFSRNVKNVNLVNRIFGSKKCREYNKICIGQNSLKYMDKDLPKTVYADLLDQNGIVSILNKSKLLIIPSYIESYSITAVEATQCGCTVLTTKNAGCAATINKFFVVDSYELEEWENKIITILKNYEYFKKIFKNTYDQTNRIDLLWDSHQETNNSPITVLFIEKYNDNGDVYDTIKKMNNDKNFSMHYICITNPMDIEQNLLTIKQKINKIDIIFCGDDELVPVCKKIFTVKIIFNPKNVDNLNNDRTIIMSSDFVLPNTSLVYDILAKKDGVKDKLCYPMLINGIVDLPNKLIGTKILTELKKMFHTIVHKYKKSVAIYKIPPLVNDGINQSVVQTSNQYFNYIEDNDESFIKDTVHYDIYFSLFVEISKKENCTDINYIVFDQNIKENILMYVYKIYPFYPSGIKIWKIKDLPSLLQFNNAAVYFMRGTYHKFFKVFLPPNAKTFYYPATSVVQSSSSNYITKMKQSFYKFDTVFVHEDKIYEQLYDTSKRVPFDKFAPDGFVYTGDVREYDICFIATENQSTKNHHLFLHLIKYLEGSKRKCKIVYITDLNCILKTNQMENFLGKLEFVELINKPRCCKEELLRIYNRTKINIIFSGRDAYPRVIAESAACGCFNIALDTLSDGKSFYDNILGSLIGDDNVSKKICQSSSLSYEPDSRLWQQIIDYMEKSYDHCDISLQFKNRYNLKNVIDNIYFNTNIVRD